MTREEELKVLEEFIKKNGATKLPPGQAGPEIVISSWTRRGRGRKKKKAAAPKE